MNCNSKHRGAIVLSLFFFLPCTFSLQAQLRWDGGGSDGQWTTAANWAGDLLPSSTDEVILDNSLVAGNYTISLPGGMEVISVRSLIIQPFGGNTIELVLPTISVASPALIVMGPGYGLTIHSGGIFRNASGISSDQSVQIADSLRINNGGRYIHQTRGTHAASIAQILSKAPGTETGVVEFDIPGTAGYVISISGRTYGSLVLSANAAGTARTYSSSGGSDLTIRGNFTINSSVSYNLNLAANVMVNGDLIHTGQSLNISSGGDNTILQVQGNYLQSGIVTETSTGLPVIELCGNTPQQINMTGSIINSITLRMNNPAGVTLQSPLNLPWKLELVNGKINTSSTSLLTLLPGCEIQADSLSNSSFINGPLRKEGLISTTHFLFPVGKDIYHRWLNIRNATGSFTVEYFKSNPRNITNNYGPGVDHISSLEYWIIDADASTASPELSFADPNSGGVTDLSTLRVAQLVNNVWEDAGNISVSGSAGANGSVTGNMLTNFGAHAKYFSLAASEAANNPLPVSLPHFSIKSNGHINTLRWVYEGDDAEYFEVMHSENNRQFISIGKIYPSPGRKLYQFKHMKKGISYYQLNIARKSGPGYQSSILAVSPSNNSDWLLSVAVGEQLTLTISASMQKTETGTIIDASGRILRQFSLWLRPGINNVTVNISHLPAGFYTVRFLSNSRQFIIQ